MIQFQTHIPHIFFILGETEVKYRGGGVSQPYLKWCLHSPTGKIGGVELIIREFPTIFPVPILFFFLVFVCRFLQFYFRIHVQILVTSSNFKSGAHNICPQRNQFQMLFVTNRGVWNLEWVGREGIEGLLKRNPTFLLDWYSFQVLWHLRFPIRVAPHVHKWGVATIVLQNTASSTTKSVS